MPKPKELTPDPSLHEVWKNAKKTAEAMAKTAKRTKPFEAMMEEMGKLKFGPELDNYAPLYPDWSKMEAQKTKIEGILEKYKKTVSEQLKAIAAKKVDMPKDIPNRLMKALNEIEEALNTQAASAKSAIESDPELGVKLSKEMAKSGGILTPIVVLQHPDIAKLVVAKLGADADIIKPTKLPIEVILSDTKLLSKMTETPDLRTKVVEEAGFSTVVDEIAEAYAEAAAIIKKDPKQADAQKAAVQKRTEVIVQAAATRGAEELARITKVRTDYKMYQIKCTAEVALAVGALAAGIVSLAAGPFTGGASVILGCISLAKGAVELGTKLGKLSLEAEDFAGRLAGRISTLLERYEKAGGAKVGASEMAVNALNAVFSTTFKTISECGSDNEQLGQKINGLEVAAGDTSTKLNKNLEEQDKFLQYMRKWEQESAKVLTPKQAKAVEKLIDALDSNARSVNQLIESVINYNARVKKMRTSHKSLTQLFQTLSAKEPNWAKFGEVVIKFIVGVGFTVAGTSVVPGPDAFKCMELAKQISDAAGTTISSVTTLKDAYEGVKGLIEG